jgi:ABC-type multidrug transport system fused ATPase/permease subunit
MGKELGGVTTVVIAHRLTTIRNADKIIVLTKGKLAEEGNHDELMAKDGEYAKLIRLQGA